MMKNYLSLGAIALFTIALATFAAAIPNDDAPANDAGGVSDDSCWKNSSGNEITVEVRGTVHGDQVITVTEGEESGDGRGTPAAGGGCEESESITVDAEKYRVDGGDMQWKNGNDAWIDMTEVECDDDDDADEAEATAPGGDSIGSLPSDD